MNNKENYEDIKELIAKLNMIIDQEVDKPLEDQDMDLIKECMKFIDELEKLFKE